MKCNVGLCEHEPFLDDGYPHEHKHDHDHKHEHSHDHEHDHSHSHCIHEHRTGDKKVLKISLSITIFTMILEFVYGFLSNSLALISDAIHMLTHSFALFISLFAIVLANKKAPLQHTFGYYRVEVLAAFINGLTIVLSIFWILYEAVERFLNPSLIDLKSAFIVAFIGLVVNIITGVILMQGDKENINLKSSFVHMLSDALSSVAILIGYVVIYFTDFYLIDIILALLVAVVIGIWAKDVLKKSINTLLEASPVDVSIVKEHILKNSQVLDIHDIHIWEITQNMYNLTAHVKIQKNQIQEYEEILKALNHDLKHKFKIVHTTFQFEC